MTPERRDWLGFRWDDCEQQIQELQAKRAQSDAATDMEGWLLDEQDAIEYELGEADLAGSQMRSEVEVQEARQLLKDLMIFVVQCQETETLQGAEVKGRFEAIQWVLGETQHICPWLQS